MDITTTRELLDAFYEQKQDTIMETVKTAIDKPYLFAYEEKIGTQLVDMNEDQLLELMDVVLHHKQSGNEDQFLTMRSYDQVRNALYRLFDMYIETHPRNNPFDNPKLKRENVRKYLAANKQVFTINNVREIIQNMIFDYGSEQAGYLEMLLLLFYSGFQNYQEVLQIETHNIQWERKSIQIKGRTVQLTDRCFELFRKYYYSEYVKGKYKLLYITRWKSCAFPFMVQASLRDKMVDYNEKEAQTLLAQQYSYYILKPYRVKVTYTTMYYLGVYDRLVQQYGLQTANDIIYNTGHKYSAQREQLRHDNYLTNAKTTQITDSLLPFVRTE